MKADLIHYLAPYVLVIAALAGLALGADKEVCGGVILCGLTLINPAYKPPGPKGPQP